MNLNVVTRELEKMEISIITAIVERAQFSGNSSLYETRADGKSLLQEWLAQYEEGERRLQAITLPEDRPFSALPEPLPIEPLAADASAVDINLNQLIYQSYLDFLPRITAKDDDRSYGHTLSCDTRILKLVSRRIHAGAYYVGESKYLSASALLTAAIEKGEEEEIEQHITRQKVERLILRRVRRKARRLQKGARHRNRVPPEEIVRFYDEVIIVLTKAGEVVYLKKR